MANWKLELTSCGQSLGGVHVRREIFQGDSLSPLLFILCMIPMTLVLREVKACYEWDRKQYKVNNLLLMGNLKLFGKSTDQIDSLVQIVYVFSEDIGMEFGLKKCGALVLKRGKVVKMDGVNLPDEQTMSLKISKILNRYSAAG